MIRYFFVLVLAALAVSSAGCGAPQPGKPGEECNFDAKGTDGCDASSVCLSGECHLMCSSSSDCGGGTCQTYQMTYQDRQVQACDFSGSGETSSGGGTTSSGGTTGSSGSADCSNNCPSTCGGNVPEQACSYCQAACLCRCAGDSNCAQQNSQAAAQLGTQC